ncbi:hypothetical protein [Actinomadura harenae]|uniref:Uncharacterized protein n=1 Tax=Actinomadura harenae TaxID=2483351 RepID=A0A3M2MF14_9ACTN|nr:hypothetical protein [Actinomadura harenae]RMI47620.1 hypothetical protein EBO15_01580 [Actinomadura harenae]
MDQIRNWGHPALDHELLPPCSMVLTSGGLLVAKIASVAGHLYGLVAYVADDGRPRYWGTWSRFLDSDWQRTLGLPYGMYAPLIAARQPDALVPELGRIARIDPATIVGTVSAQDPVLLAEHAKVLDTLANWCGVHRDQIGLQGSAMYKPAASAGDLDVVIYGRADCRRVHARAAGAVPPRPADHPHHLHFHVPGHRVTLDPRYISGEHTITRALVTGDFTDEGNEPIDRLWVTEAGDGIFFPSRYTLSDGSVLLSYRAGHSAWLRLGDEVTGPALPVYQHQGVRYRVVLRCEQLHPRRAEHE